MEEGKFSKLFLSYLTRTVSSFSILNILLSFCSHQNFPLPLLSIRYLNGNPARNSNYVENLGYFRHFRVSSTSAHLVSRLSIKKENINLLLILLTRLFRNLSDSFHMSKESLEETRDGQEMKVCLKQSQITHELNFL